MQMIASHNNTWGADSVGPGPDVLDSRGDGSRGAGMEVLTLGILSLDSSTGAPGTGGAGGASAGGTGAAGARGARAGGAGGTRAAGVGGARVGGAGGTGAASARGARSRVTGTAGAGGASTRGAGAAGAGGARAGSARGTRAIDARGARAGGARGAGAGGTRGARAGGAGGDGAAGGTGTAPRRPLFYPQPQSSLPPPDSALRQPPFLPGSPLLAPFPYPAHIDSLAERREPKSRPPSPVCTVSHASCPRPPPVPGTHTMALRSSSIPHHVALSSPPMSSLPDVPNPESDCACAASPTVTRLLATVVTDPSFESTAASALVTELVNFAARSRLDYVASLLECLTTALPCFASMLLCPEEDPNALDIPTPHSYAEAIAGEYSSQWQTPMDAEMASWTSTDTCVDKVPPSGVNIVDGMWIFRVKRPSGSPPAFKARYVAQGFNQQQGVEFFHTFSPVTKMTTLRVLLHGAAQHDYEMHSLDFSTAFLQGSLHKEIWLHCLPGFWWRNTLRMTLAALGFAPSTADLSLLLRTDSPLPPLYILVCVDDLVFATADTEALTLVKAELQKRHTCTT
ncbi:unnamed protein product [Closterium sp. NIES-54]